MKNSSSFLQTKASLQARQAIRQIRQCTEKHYPQLAESKKTALIIECLIELSIEKKLTAARS